MPNDDSQPTKVKSDLAITNCPNCGASISADSKFCSNCGSRTQQFPVFTEADTQPGAGVADTPPPPQSSSSDTPPPAPRPAKPPLEPPEPPIITTAERRGQDPTANSPTAQRLKKELDGRYEIIRELGRGGMATVFLAKDSKHGRNVAIKVLHPELSASIGGDRFEREIRVVAALQHPNILGLYDSGTADGLLYYVMPFVDGESLRDKIDREGQLPVEEAMRITLEVANALGYAHGKGIIHRDIKPENILLSGEMTLVADFGIARAASEANTQKLTQTGMAIGTPLYMAPEQAGGEAVGPSADIYSLGCMLYEMLAGEPPFTGKNPIAIMARHAMEQVPSIRIVRSSVPPEVEEAIFAAMGKVPADRPQTAAEFAEVMGTPLGSTTAMRVRGRTTAYPIVGAPSRRRWGLIGGAAAAALVVVGGIGYWAYTANSAPPDAVGFAPERIAVLYFADQSRGGELGHVADGLTEALIEELRQVRNLDVISTNGVLPFRGSTARRDSIGRELSAGTLVEGSVEGVDDDRVRINVRLLDGNSGADIGERASFEAPRNNLLAMRDTVTTRVASLIRTRVGEEVRLREERAGTSNAAAWSLLQQALRTRKDALVDWRAGNRDEAYRKYAVVDSLLAESERLDPRWTEPTVQRGQLAFRLSVLAADRQDVLRLTDEGLDHARRALEREPENAAAVELRGTMLFQRYLRGAVADPTEADNLLRQAETLFRDAVRLDPGRTFALYALSFINYNRGDILDAKVAARQAYEEDAYLENAEQVLDLLYATSYAMEHFDDAVQYCGIGQRRFPQNPIFVQCQLELLGTRRLAPDVDAAWRLIGELEPLVPKPAWELKSREARMYAAAVISRAGAAGMADSARRVLERSRGNPEVDPYGLLLRLEIWVRSVLGDTDQAIRLATQLLAVDPGWRHQEQKFPHWWYRTLREDPRFQALMGT
jgi:TolB-like protein